MKMHMEGTDTGFYFMKNIDTKIANICMYALRVMEAV